MKEERQDAGKAKEGRKEFIEGGRRTRNKENQRWNKDSANKEEQKKKKWAEEIKGWRKKKKKQRKLKKYSV